MFVFVFLLLLLLFVLYHYWWIKLYIYIKRLYNAIYLWCRKISTLGCWSYKIMKVTRHFATQFFSRTPCRLVAKLFYAILLYVWCLFASHRLKFSFFCRPLHPVLSALSTIVLARRRRRLANHSSSRYSVEHLSFGLLTIFHDAHRFLLLRRVASVVRLIIIMMMMITIGLS